MTAPTIVGAYAAMPRAIAERECLYRSLAETGWVDGIEIPYRDGLDADPRWLADQLRDRFAHCVVTAIPGTMGQLAGDPTSVWRPPTSRGVNEHSSGSPTSLTTCEPCTRWSDTPSSGGSRSIPPRVVRPTRKHLLLRWLSSPVSSRTLDLPSSSSTVTRLVASDRARRSSSVWTTRSPRWSVRGCT